jgi:geranylgeranyl diphosphate synthase type I
MKELMKHYKHKIDLELESFFDARIRKAGEVSPAATEAFEVLKEFSLRGGKRIRPMLTVFSYKGFGGKRESEIIKAALAVELMESFLLIHDDIIDQDELRRGYLTVHKIYENRLRKKHGAGICRRLSHYGDSVAIVIGDIASVLGSEAILSTDFPVRRKLRAVEKFNRVIINTCFGQILDINSENEKAMTEEDILTIHTLKTAIYTIEGPLHIGAILAGASQRNLEQLTRFAIPLGKAFQLNDDILGMFGAQERIGKPVGSDIKEGKKTLLILKALEHANSGQKRAISQSLGNRSLSRAGIERVRKIVKDTGSLDYSRRLMLDYIRQARLALDRIRMRKEGKHFLAAVADYIVNREK